MLRTLLLPDDSDGKAAKRLFAVRGEMDPWNERHAAVLTALLKRITDL